MEGMLGLVEVVSSGLEEVQDAEEFRLELEEEDWVKDAGETVIASFLLPSQSGVLVKEVSIGSSFVWKDFSASA